MRWPLWRHADSDSDTLDPELLSVFANSTRLPEIGVADLARGRARVAAQLAPGIVSPVAGGWLRRRFAWSAAGGGSMWAALAGTAFASKASTAAVGLTVLLAGAGTAEVTGIGPAVRESLGITQPASNDNNGGAVDTLVIEGDGDANASENAAEQAANVGASSDEPGQQVTHFRPNGTFSMRGTLVTPFAEGTLTADTTNGPLNLELVDPTITLPAANGNPNVQGDPKTLADFDGYLVFFTGWCEEPQGGDEFDIGIHCKIDRVTVLGRAGQGGQPDEPGQPSVLPGNAPEDAGQPENPGQSGLQPNNGQPPVGSGQPESTPPANAPGGNPNSD